MGSNDEGQLGRVGDENTLCAIDTPYPIDMISSGEAHSIAANSTHGVAYFWGVFKNTFKGRMAPPENLPKRIGENEFPKKKIAK